MNVNSLLVKIDISSKKCQNKLKLFSEAVPNRSQIILPITLLIFSFSIFVQPTDALQLSTISSPLSLHHLTFASTQFEAADPSTLQDPVVDPNFNVMRNKELGKTKAIPLLVAVLLIAILTPVATWWYLSK